MLRGISVICNRSKLFLFKKYYFRIKSVAKYGIVHMQEQINYIPNHRTKNLLSNISYNFIYSKPTSNKRKRLSPLYEYVM
jgi:hypothetical protein